MPNVDVQVVLQGVSALPDDVFVNTLHFDNGGVDSDNDLASGIIEAYTAFSTQLGGVGAGCFVKLYNPGLNPTGPAYQEEFSLAGTAGTGGPTEVALCLSYATADDPAQSVPRRRGRIYLGPFTENNAKLARPSTTLRNAALQLGQDLAQIGTASATTWVMRSQVENSYHKIESIWVDDSWDTQRRRGLAPTGRIVQDVQ